MFWGADNIRLLCLMTAAVLVERLLADGHQRIPAHACTPLYVHATRMHGTAYFRARIAADREASRCRREKESRNVKPHDCCCFCFRLCACHCCAMTGSIESPDDFFQNHEDDKKWIAPECIKDHSSDVYGSPGARWSFLK